VHRLTLADLPSGGLSVLAIGAHADDIEIGCGGTILWLVRQGMVGRVTWLVLSAVGDRAVEADRSACAFLEGVERSDIRLEGFRDGFLAAGGEAAKEVFEAHKAVAPDLVLTHRREDLHQDHRYASELTWQTFRDHLILEYEVPKYDGDLGPQNIYVEIDEALARRKCELLLAGFPSQAAKPWFTEETFRSLLRLRGIEARSSSGYAEGFTARKIVLGRGGR
jgi:LmbE family N-acetylglucosaminyl deacetylase